MTKILPFPRLGKRGAWLLTGHWASVAGGKMVKVVPSPGSEMTLIMPQVFGIINGGFFSRRCGDLLYPIFSWVYNSRITTT
jgi:hypothetical protein